MKPDHVHVFYTDPRNGWVSQVRDAEGNQIGEAFYFYLKTDAIGDGATHGLPVHIFGKNGLLQRVIPPDHFNG